MGNSDSHARLRTLEVPWDEAYLPSKRAGRGFERLDGFEREATYVYRDANGLRVFSIAIYRNPETGEKEPETIRPLGSGRGQLPRVLYDLPELLTAIRRGRRVFLVEGEKDAEAIKRAGGIATTAPWGANHWADEYTRQLAGARLVIVGDDDEPGWARVERLVAELTPVVRSLRVVKAREGKDASDHLAAGFRLDEFEEVRP
jgi:hypothetical protein